MEKSVVISLFFQDGRGECFRLNYATGCCEQVFSDWLQIEIRHSGMERSGMERSGMERSGMGRSGMGRTLKLF